MWETQDFISNLLRMISIKFIKWLHLTDMAIMTIPDSLYNVRRLIKLDRSNLFTFVGRVYLFIVIRIWWTMHINTDARSLKMMLKPK